jgi:hypothetical protein
VTSGIFVEMDDITTEVLPMSLYFEPIEYIPLETTSECLIGNNPRVYVVDNKIVTIDERNCFIFDRLTGKFLEKIGINGRGPDDYLSIPRGLIVNEHDMTVYLGQGGGLIEYFLKDTSIPSRRFQFPSLLINHLVYVERDLWAIGLINYRGDNVNQLMFHDRMGVVDSILNHDKFEMRTHAINIDPGEILFYRYDDDVYYKNRYNDTVFRIADKKLQPTWIFRMGRSMKFLGELRGDVNALVNDTKHYYLINSILETDKYLFYTAKYENTNHAYVFYKQEHQLTEVEHEGFLSDIDSGLPFWPKYYNNSEDELVDVWYAYKMKDLLTEEYFAANPAKDPAAHERLRALLKNLKEDDNPVIVIAKLKK